MKKIVSLFSVAALLTVALCSCERNNCLTRAEKAEGWQLLFNGCATIRRNPEKNTPVLIWEISERDEKRLDIYEGWPRYYYKQELEVETFPLDGGAPVNLTAMVYIMSEGYDRGDPTPFYYSILEDGYKAFRFPMHVLRQALRDSIGAKEARAFLRKGGFRGVRR